MDLTPVLPDPFSVSLRSVTLAPEQITLVLTATLPRMVARYARRTCRLQSALEVLGLVLGGEVGGPQCYTLR